jgi:hypothetical protein
LKVFKRRLDKFTKKLIRFCHRRTRRKHPAKAVCKAQQAVPGISEIFRFLFLSVGVAGTAQNSPCPEGMNYLLSGLPVDTPVAVSKWIVHNHLVIKTARQI